MTGATISTRLPTWLDEALRELFQANGEGPSEGLRRVAEEWWAMNRYPKLEFRDGTFERRAALRDGPEVWEIVFVQRDYREDLVGLYEHFGPVDREAIDQALAYYQESPQRIDRRIEENDRIGQRLETEWLASRGS